MLIEFCYFIIVSALLLYIYAFSTDYKTNIAIYFGISFPTLHRHGLEKQVTATDGDKDRPQNIVYFLTGQGIDPDNPANSKFDINRTTGEIFVLKVSHNNDDWKNSEINWENSNLSINRLSWTATNVGANK